LSAWQSRCFAIFTSKNRLQGEFIYLWVFLTDLLALGATRPAKINAQRPAEEMRGKRSSRSTQGHWGLQAGIGSRAETLDCLAGDRPSEFPSAFLIVLHETMTCECEYLSSANWSWWKTKIGSNQMRKIDSAGCTIFVRFEVFRP
jgi:hypothetical protein